MKSLPQLRCSDVGVLGGDRIVSQCDTYLMVIPLSGEPVVASLSLIATLVVSLALAFTIIGYIAWPRRRRSRVRELQKARPATDRPIVTDTRRQPENRGLAPVPILVPLRARPVGPERLSTNPLSHVRKDAIVVINRTRLPREHGEQR